MAIRTDLVEVEEIFRRIGISILDIENEVFSFDNKINSISTSNTKAIPRLQECILHYRNARNKLRGFLKLEDNQYLDSDSLNKMDEDIGRLDSDINKKEKDILEKSDTMDFYKKSEMRNIKINPLKNLLKEAMEIQIINALINSAKRWDIYKEKKMEVKDAENKDIKKKIDKDIYLYNFYLFQEMYPASQSLGGFTRQEIKSLPKNLRIFNPNPMSQQKPTNPDSSQEQSEEELSDTEEDLFEEDEDKDELY